MGLVCIELSAKLVMVKMKEILESMDIVVFTRGALVVTVGTVVVEG